MLKKFIIGGAATLLVLANVLEIGWPPEPRLLYNPTVSAPTGWYKIDRKSAVKRGDLVAGYAPDWARKLADERRYLPWDYPSDQVSLGDCVAIRICINNSVVSVPNYPDMTLQAQDSLGRDMPINEGCFYPEGR